MKTRRKTLHSFSQDKLDFKLPKSWTELKDEELRYVIFAITQFPMPEAKTAVFIRLTGIRVLEKAEQGWRCSVSIGRFKKISFEIESWQIVSFLNLLDWMEQPGVVPTRLSHVDGCTAVDSELHGVPFRDYLAIENYYQGFLFLREDQMLCDIARLLYKKKNGQHPDVLQMDAVEIYSVFNWLMQIKNLFAERFPHFFQRCESAVESVPDMESIMNSEIRALTGGDLTKEELILDQDVWRALTELNEKAREAKEFNERMKSYGR